MEVFQHWSKNKTLFSKHTYLNLWEYICKYQPEKILGYIAFEKNNPIGVYVTHQIASNKAGIYCGITIHKYTGLTDTLDWLLYRKLYKLGVKKILVGGSENRGVWDYLQKYCPSSPTEILKSGYWNQ